MHAGPDGLRALFWPLYTFDFEASGLQPRNHPIEVGVCRWRSPDHPIEGWSTLIRPTEFWAEHGSWSAEAEGLHGIQREELTAGMTPAQTINALNKVIGSYAAYCDSPPNDFAWMRRLALTAKVPTAFKMGDVDLLFGHCDRSGYTRLVHWLDRAPARHRARDDAERLMRALAYGLGLEFGASVDIELPSTWTDVKTFDPEQFLRDKEAKPIEADEAAGSGSVPAAELQRRSD